MLQWRVDKPPLAQATIHRSCEATARECMVRGLFLILVFPPIRAKARHQYVKTPHKVELLPREFVSYLPVESVVEISVVVEI